MEVIVRIKRKKRNLAILLLIIFVSIETVRYMTWSENYICELQTIDDEGNYDSYNTVSSNTPAHNYEIINVGYDNKLYTLKGEVTINYTNKRPYIKIKRTRLVYGDEYDLYIPKGTVLYMEGVATR